MPGTNEANAGAFEVGWETPCLLISLDGFKNEPTETILVLKSFSTTLGEDFAGRRFGS